VTDKVAEIAAGLSERQRFFVTTAPIMVPCLARTISTSAPRKFAMFAWRRQDLFQRIVDLPDPRWTYRLRPLGVAVRAYLMENRDG